eukprot:COSAG04_NODE_7186_length_1171_cov_28.338583_1_plen_47_part_10
MRLMTNFLAPKHEVLRDVQVAQGLQLLIAIDGQQLGQRRHGPKAQTA